MLYTGEEQSNIFDTVVACNILVMIRYLLLVYVLSKPSLAGPLGPIFRQVSEAHTIIMIPEIVWAYVKELIFKSINIFCHKNEPDLLFHLFNIIEDTIITKIRLVAAKHWFINLIFWESFGHSIPIGQFQR
jgi:hypothetical protein